MFGQWKCAAASVAVIVLGTACSSSGSPSPAPGGQSSVADTASATSPVGGVTAPGVSSPAGGSGDGECLSASEVTDITGTSYDDVQAVAGSCTYVSANGGINIFSAPISGGEETTVSTLGQQFADIEPIPGEEHAYAARSVGQVWLFTDDQLILVGSSDLDNETALAIAKAFAG